MIFVKQGKKISKYINGKGCCDLHEGRKKLSIFILEVKLNGYVYLVFFYQEERPVVRVPE